jgi:ketosteroid isomerase-like protein
MKTRSLLTFAGLTICFAMSALPFSGDLAGDVKALDELSALSMKCDDAYKNKDATALAALFTEDAVCVTPEGLFSGRQAIEEAFADDFQRWPASSHIHQADRLNAIGSEAWSIGQWWLTLQGQNGPFFARGYWSALFVREGDGWKFRMLTFNESPPHVQPARAQ